MEIKDVFSAQPKSVWEYLCENGQGLYIPAYQRQYSWDKTKISRLIEDTCHGFTMLVEHNDAITFIGTIIAIHDTELLTVEPLVKGDVPAKVMTIIDGQQRLTTLLLINTILHEEIKLRSKKLGNEGEETTWLYEECMKIISRLGKTFEEDKDYGDGSFRYYPRMIRSYNDSWSRKKDKAKYQSPIGHYLHKYGEHIRKSTNNKFIYLPNTQQETKYDFLKEGRVEIQKQITSIAKNKSSGQNSVEFPSFEKIINSTNFQNILLKADLPKKVSQLLVSESNEQYKELTRIILLANFILDRIAITIVTAKNEDYAFDMFESLNTTGEPLTAFETFKPRVIYSENLQNYESSKSFQYIDITEGYFESSKDKQDSTKRLIVYFALAETGRLLSLRLSEQRRYLRNTYEDLLKTKQQEFVQHLSHVALFMKTIWKKKKDIPEITFIDDDELLLCLDVLRQLNHTITIAMLTRFYSDVINSESKDDNQEKIKNFVSAVKAITAFSILWKSSRKGTQGIDAIYRELMASGYSSVELPPLARVKNDIPLNTELLKKAFIDILEKKGSIVEKNDWVKKVSRLPAYSNQKEVTRFILLAAAHDTIEDPTMQGLAIESRSGVSPLLNFSSWRGETAQTVEHIAPNKCSAGWDGNIYEDADTIQTLGNLTLLPKSENSSLGNTTWKRKKLIYQILSTKNEDELKSLLLKAKQQKIEIRSSTTELLKNSNYLPMVQSIANVNEWSLCLIEKRSIRIAELAWERIYIWLDE